MTKPMLFNIDASAFTAAAIAYGDKFDSIAATIIEDGIQRSAEVVQRAVVKTAKKHRRTGRLERQIKIQGTGAGWNRAVRVKSGGRVAHLIAGPVRAHEIRVTPAERAMPLMIAGSVRGFADVVQHPATPGDPYFRRGVNNARLAVFNVLKATGRKLTRHLAEITEKGAA